MRVAITDRFDVPNQNTIHTSVRTCKTVLSGKSAERWAMLEVLRNYCEIRGVDLDIMLPQTT